MSSLKPTCTGFFHIISHHPTVYLKNFISIIGMKQTQTSWSSHEKELTERFFYDEIYNNNTLKYPKVINVYKDN